MPATNIGAFWISGVLHAWKWIDSENSSFLTWRVSAAPSNFRSDFVIDRTGTTPVLRWQHSETGADSLPLVDGAYYYVQHYPGEDSAIRPVEELDQGWWVSDPTGRPYTLSDLLAGA